MIRRSGAGEEALLRVVPVQGGEFRAGGLLPGAYEVSAGGRRAGADVRAGAMAEVELRR